MKRQTNTGLVPPVYNGNRTSERGLDGGGVAGWLHSTRKRLRVGCMAAIAGLLLTVTGCSGQDFADQFQRGRKDSVGSPHGDLPAEAEATSPDGKYIARLQKDGAKILVLDRKTSKALGVIYDGSANKPKAFAFSADGSKFAVLTHNAGEVNTITIVDTQTQKEEKTLSFTGEDYYHELIWYPDGRIACLLAWKGLGAVLDPTTDKRTVGATWKMPMPAKAPEKKTS